MPTHREAQVPSSESAAPHNPLMRGPETTNDGGVDGLFAATPPLEALRMLVSEAATYNPSAVKDTGKVFMTNDVARAFIEAPSASSYRRRH